MQKRAEVSSLLSYDSIWIGASDFHNANRIMYIDHSGAPIGAVGEAWAAGEPMHSRGDCVEMQWSEMSLGVEFDMASCHGNKHFVCEQDL